MRVINKKIMAALLAVLMFALFVFGCDGGLSGCVLSGFNLSFKESRIILNIGETLELKSSDFNDYPDGGVTLSSDDDKTVIVSGMILRAVAEGTATVTAKTALGVTAQIEVEVTPGASSIELVTKDAAVDLNSRNYIDITAVINGGAVNASSFGITWKVDGKDITYNSGGKISTYYGGGYTVTSGSEKLFTVEASVKDGQNTIISDEIKVLLFDGENYKPELFYDGVITQTAPYSEVKFSVTKRENLITEWFVNGESRGIMTDFDFTPSFAGYYEIYAAANGIKTQPVTVSAAGEALPSALEADFDTYYPKIKVSWQGEPQNYTLTAVNGKTKKTYETDENSVMLTEGEIDIFSDSTVFTLKAGGDGNALVSSDKTVSVTLDKLESGAKNYLTERKFGNGAPNSYIDSDEEFYEFYDFSMLYRQTEMLNYMGYNSSYSAAELSNKAFNRAAYTGSYEIRAVTVGGKDSNGVKAGSVVNISFTYNTDNVPDMSYISKSKTVNEFDGQKASFSGQVKKDRTFSIDSVSKTISVSTTDQLYRAAEQGYRPLPKKGSSAEKYYAAAKEVLSVIVSDGMTDAQKALAVYDFIMWKVFYDNSAAKVTELSEAVKYPAYYIESVFIGLDGEGDIGSASVCDGMSKAFSLMMNIEGVECIRVIGDALTGGEYGGHAWNKVKIDGEWYIADCTWGDIQTSVGFLKTFTGETASRLYFLKTDSEVSETHFEQADSDYPRTSTIPYNLHAEFSGYADTVYVYDEDSFDGLAEDIAKMIAENYDGFSNIISYNGTQKTSSKYSLGEVKFAHNIAVTSFETFMDKVKDKLARKGILNSSYSRFSYRETSSDGDYALVIAAKTVF